MDTTTKPAHALVKIHSTAEPIRFDHTGFAIERLMIAIVKELRSPQYKNRGGEIVIRISTDGPIKYEETETDKANAGILAALERSQNSDWSPPQWDNEYVEIILADPLVPEYKGLFTARGREGKSQAYINSLIQHVHSKYQPGQIHEGATSWPTLS